MEKEFVPYEQALALKELGFDDKTLKTYDTSVVLVNGKYLLDNWYDVSTVDEVKAPLYQQAFRWFRDKYDLNYVIVKAESWFYTINGCNTQEGFNTYEEAELECLKKLIEIRQSQKTSDESPHTRTFRTPSSDYNSRGQYRK